MTGPDTPSHDDEPRDGRNDAGDAGRAGPAGDRFDDDDFMDQPAKLDLGDEAVTLPWLRSDDEDEDDQGHGAGQLVGLLLMGLLAIALIVGGIWWFTRKSDDGDLVADGSVIEAPDQPYRQKPEDPEGKTFAGTGDTSFAVSQGETRPARLGEGEGAPAQDAKPGFVSVPQPGASAAPAKPAAGAKPSDPAAAADASAVGVQVGAFSSRTAAEAGWSRLAQQHSILSTTRHRIVEGKADIGTVYRLQALAPDAGAARALCGQLKAAGVSCQVKN